MYSLWEMYRSLSGRVPAFCSGQAEVCRNREQAEGKQLIAAHVLGKKQSKEKRCLPGSELSDKIISYRAYAIPIGIMGI